MIGKNYFHKQSYAALIYDLNKQRCTPRRISSLTAFHQNTRRKREQQQRSLQQGGSNFKVLARVLDMAKGNTTVTRLSSSDSPLYVTSANKISL